MQQPRVTADDVSQHGLSTIAVLHVSRVNHGMDKIALGVGHDVTLSALGLLAGIVAPRHAAPGRLDALTIHAPRGGKGFAPDASRPISNRG